MLYVVFDLLPFFDALPNSSKILPSRDPVSLLVRVSGSENMIELSSFSGDGGVGGGTGVDDDEIVGRMEERIDVRLFDCCDEALLASVVVALSASSLEKGLSIIITFVGMLGVHRNSPVGGSFALLGVVSS